MMDFLLWFVGILWSGGLLVYFYRSRNEDVITSRIGVFILALFCLVPLVNLVTGLAFTYKAFEGWLNESPFNGD